MEYQGASGVVSSSSSSSSSNYYSTFENNNLREVARLPREFCYEELKMATDNFQDKLGSGGSGSVFKGVLKNGTMIAVKRVDRVDYGERVFRDEISTIASVQHIHVIRIRGYCHHLTKTGMIFFIVYDLLINGSLDSWIFPQIGCQAGRYLSWKLRYKVAIEIAKALAYLHHDCLPQILHLDIKPENILLDKDFRAVLSDFGLSKLMNEDRSIVHTMERGTPGYIAPEWFSEQGISVKSDIFSFGKVLLDLFFGQRYVCLDANGKNISTKRGNSLLKIRAFHDYMWEKLIHKELVYLIDKRIIEDGVFEEREVNHLVHTALVCLDEDPMNRPADMRQVVSMLEEWNDLAGKGTFEQNFKPQTEYNILGSESLSRKFRYKDIKKATDNFSDKIGSGASSIVYKGTLDDGRLVAVKRLIRPILGEQELQDDISAFASVDHHHVVCLYGYCSHITQTERTLFVIYDLFPNGSLDKWIFPRADGGNGGCLPWKLRYKVAIEIAKALAYLHHDCHCRFHLDVKPEIILLDDKFQAVLSSLGNRVNARGRKGYTAPEFSVHGTYEKSDIFSYGKVLLDLFFGKSDVCLGRDGNDIYANSGYSLEEQRSFLAFMWKALRKNRIMKLVDKRLMKEQGVDKEEADCLIYVALWCLQEDPQRRVRDMRHVVDILGARKINRSIMFRFSSEFTFLFPVKDHTNQSAARFLREFRYKELQIATNNFRDKLGNDVYGTVFKGILNDGTLVAVNKLPLECLEQQFEVVVSAVANIKHDHLLSLIGYCNRSIDTERCYFIVNNLAPKGSLVSGIFQHGNEGVNDQCLSLKERYNVAMDIAKAIAYLHHDCHPRMHIQIKPENVLLIDNFRAVCNFGLYLLMPNRPTSDVELDVLCFGELLLDLFFGRQHVCFDGYGHDISIEDSRSEGQNRVFLAFMWEKLRTSTLTGLADKRLRWEMQFNAKEASSLIYVALWCLQENPEKRPNMQRVVEMLEERIPIEKQLKPDDTVCDKLCEAACRVQ